MQHHSSDFGFGVVVTISQKNGMSWPNFSFIIVIMLVFIDGTRANLGVSNSIKTWVILKNGNCYFMGCPCHIIHNTAHKGLVGFTRVTKFDIESFWIKAQSERMLYQAM